MSTTTETIEGHKYFVTDQDSMATKRVEVVDCNKVPVGVAVFDHELESAYASIDGEDQTLNYYEWRENDFTDVARWIVGVSY